MAEDQDHHHQHQHEQDKLLPIANVGRIMKQILPSTSKISKEAKETMQECATEFISFVTGEASDKCQKDNRRTVNGDDICWALGSLGFDNYADAMVRFLQKHREFENQKLIKAKLEGSIINHDDASLIPNLALGPPNEPESPIPFEYRFLDQGESSSINAKFS